MYFLALIFSLLLNSCVTVNVGEEPAKKATDIKYEAPSAPFSNHQSINADKSWLSSKTGNIIAFTSECPKNSDPSLDVLLKESIESLDHVEIIENNRLSFNGREAIQSFAKGSIDGVPLAMKSLIFKKNGCNYKLIYSGLLAKISAEQNQFEAFCKGFVVP